jgi:hypothetical protein
VAKRKIATADPSTTEAVVVEEKSLELVPEFKSTRKIRNADLVQKKILNENIEGMLTEAVQVLRIKLRAGDKDALRLALEIGKLVGAKSSVTVNTNVNQANINEAKAAVALTSKGFDDLVRRLDGREYQVTTDADFVQG